MIYIGNKFSFTCKNRRMTMHYGSSIIFCLLFSVALLCQGCGKVENEEDIKNALNQNQSKRAQNETGVSDSSDEHLSYTVEGANSDAAINVDADVKVYSGKLPIFAIKNHEADDTYIKNLADRIFDNGEAQYIKPYYISSQEELDQERDRIKSILDLYGEQQTPYQLSDDILELSKVMDNFKQENVQEVPDGQYYAKTVIDDDYDNQDPYEIMSCKFVGQIDGVDWILSSTKNEKYHHTVIYPNFQHEPIINVISNYDTTYQNVTANVDQKQSEMQAKEWVAKLGYPDFNLIDTSKTLTINDQKQGVINGYMFTYARTFDGIDTGYLRYSLPYTDNIPTWNTYDPADIPQEYVSIYVDSFGVEQIDLLSNYELGEKLAESAELLSFDKIDEIVKTQIKRSLDQVKNVGAEINNIELKYMAVSDKNSKYSFMPVWIYHLNYGYLDIPVYTQDICVNAVDGTIVNSQISFNYYYNVINGITPEN